MDTWQKSGMDANEKHREGLLLRNLKKKFKVDV